MIKLDTMFAMSSVEGPFLMTCAVRDFSTECLEEDSFSSACLQVGILHIDECAEVVVCGDAWAD